MSFELYKSGSVGACCAIGYIANFYVYGSPVDTKKGMVAYQEDLRKELERREIQARKAGESLLFASLREDQVAINEPALLEVGFKKVFDEPSYRDPGYDSNGAAMFVYLKQINPGIDRKGQYRWTPVPQNILALCSTPKKEEEV